MGRKRKTNSPANKEEPKKTKDMDPNFTSPTGQSGQMCGTASSMSSGQVPYQNLMNSGFQMSNIGQYNQGQGMNTGHGYVYGHGSPNLPAGPFISGTPCTPLTPVATQTGDQSLNQAILSKLEVIENKLAKLDSIEAQVKGLSQKLCQLDSRVQTLESHQQASERKLNDLETSRNFDSQVNEDLISKQSQIERDLKDQNKNMSGEINRLKQENCRLSEDLLDVQSRSMRDNLLFYGFDECDSYEQRRSENCVDRVLGFCVDNLMIGDAKERLKIDRAHRIGKYRVGRKRPVVVKFNYFPDKLEVKEKAREHLRNTDFRVGEQFPKTIQERRKKLMPMLRKALEENKSAYLSYDKLFIDRKMYTADMVSESPEAEAAGDTQRHAQRD